MSQVDTPTTFDRHQHGAEDRAGSSSELQMLQEISRTILGSVDVRMMMDGILNKASEIGGFDIGMISFVTTAPQTLGLVAHFGFRDHEDLTTYPAHLREQATAGIGARVMGIKECRDVDVH